MKIPRNYNTSEVHIDIMEIGPANHKISPMKKECPEIVTKNVRVYLEMSGKCLSFDPKNDQIFRPDFF